MYIPHTNKGFSGRATAMKRLLAMVVLGFLALGIAGFSAGGAAAGPARCAPNAATVLDQDEALADLVALTEQPATAPRGTLSDGAQYACNSSCARACAARFGRCPTRECRQQFSACVRGCGC
jgi:hypothetical protein